MNRNWIKLAVIPALALATLLAGCDSIMEPSTPSLEPGLVVYSTSGKRFVVAKESSAAPGMVTATIGAAGGKLMLGKHELHVARNAVSESTVFTMTRDQNDPLRINLTAGRTGVNDIGSAGFAAPVTLRLSFDDASDLPANLGTMTVIYFRPDGAVDELRTGIDYTGKSVAADLPHFSGFGLAWPF